MEKQIIKVKNEDFKIGKVCAVNVFNEGIDIQIELEPLFKMNCMEQIFVSWWIKNDYTSPIEINVCSRLGDINTEGIYITAAFKDKLKCVIKGHIDKYGLKEY